VAQVADPDAAVVAAAPQQQQPQEQQGQEQVEEEDGDGGYGQDDVPAPHQPLQVKASLFFPLLFRGSNFNFGIYYRKN
jgi:hypothetical protein